MTKILLLALASTLLLIRCSKEPGTLFNLLPPEKTGIDFQNDVMEDEYLNILSNEYIYNGAGVGIGDFDKDDLMDVFFSGSQVTNRLYLNRGNLNFEDISLDAGISGRSRWSTGVAVVDINGDGWTDIYVCSSNHLDPEMRRNQLYIHEGLNDEGIPVFSEQSKAYGIDDEGYSTHAAFFDYDNDGDLDLYVLTNFLDTPTPNKYRPKKTDGSAESNDRLYRNKGENVFVNVTQEAGIVYEGYGLGISIVDFNEDGWSDLYITNDYLTNDLMYINNRDGSFTNRIDQYIKHQTHSAMGHDIADINNDGMVDIFTLDMLPEDNQGMKKMHGVTRFEYEQLNRDLGYQPQYKRNMLQLNNGTDAFGNHIFSEIGLYAGVHATEWSWAALLADFDNDGFRDLFVSNGYPRDVTDLDYAVSGMSRGRGMSNEEQMMMIPVRSMSNYMFKNNGNLTFSNNTKSWGLDKPSFSNGAAYVDLDNDGDLDLITSNYNEPALVYENTLNDHGKEITNHYLRLKLHGKSHPARLAGSGALGARVYLFSNNEIKCADHSNFRGYRSTVEPVIHFGLGEVEKIDSMMIVWPDGKRQQLYNISGDQTLEVAYAPNLTGPPEGVASMADSLTYLFKEVSSNTIKFRHKEKIFDDFRVQETVPHQFSQSGPPLAVGDIDGDGLEDVLIGGSANEFAAFFLQKNHGFKLKVFDHDPVPEDTDALLFDADNDHDPDLYLVNGSMEAGLNPSDYQDRVFVNDGQGNFRFSQSALPEMPVSGSCVRAIDFDEDGDLDLFVGGRLIPGRYPEKAGSFVLRNDSEKDALNFTDITPLVCPELQHIGLVTDAIWIDFNHDGQVDLVVVGEWMPITYFEHRNGKLVNITENTGISNRTGWWNCIEPGDFDRDGDVDFIAGNEGLNSWFKASASEPMIAYASDFDHNGRFDVVLTSYQLSSDGTRRAFPVHFKSDLGKQLEMMKRKFPTYAGYGEATIEDLFTPQELENAQKSMATWMANSYVENLGNSRFKISKLPLLSQMAPVNDMIVEDLNGDGNPDALILGNNCSNSVFWGPMDAMNGLLMLGDGHGGFECRTYAQSGFYVPGNARSLVKLKLADDRDLFIVSQNRDSLKVFERNK
ncbi:MAG: VCBS repeat-containing protein [Cytophagales bacterium]|nr:VCBS repeat-containing protein [Cytophagales bacterium]